VRRVENKSRTITCIAQPSRANVDQLDTGSIEHVNGEQSRASSSFVRCWREALHFDHSPASLPKTPLKKASRISGRACQNQRVRDDGKKDDSRCDVQRSATRGKAECRSNHVSHRLTERLPPPTRSPSAASHDPTMVFCFPWGQPLTSKAWEDKCTAADLKK
jgi:hypothetical protein